MFIIINSEDEKMNFTSNDEWIADEIDYLEFDSYDEADDYLRIYDEEDDFNVSVEISKEELEEEEEDYLGYEVGSNTMPCCKENM